MADPATVPASRKRSELIAFLLLAILIWPVIAIAFVATWGFVVWMFQLIAGPPGPPPV